MFYENSGNTGRMERIQAMSDESFLKGFRMRYHKRHRLERGNSDNLIRKWVPYRFHRMQEGSSEKIFHGDISRRERFTKRKTDPA